MNNELYLDRFRRMNPVSVLESESDAPFDLLMDIHNDYEKRASDSYMLYVAGWAAMYASQKIHENSDEAFAIAQRKFQEISAHKIDTSSPYTKREIPLKAAFVHELASYIRTPKHIYSLEDRAITYTGLSKVIERGLVENKIQKHETIMGCLGEIVIAGLCWRPNSMQFYKLNTVPAGPMKDARNHGLSSLNTDLYAYHPGMPSKGKRRENLQVKLTNNPTKTRQYDQDKIIVIGLNDLMNLDNKLIEYPTGYDSCLKLAHMLLKDMSGQSLKEYENKLLHNISSHLHDKIINMAFLKRERRAAMLKNSAQ